jgi:hypothetical protein
VLEEQFGVSAGRSAGSGTGFRLKCFKTAFARFQPGRESFNLRSGLFSSLEIIKANPGISWPTFRTSSGSITGDGADRRPLEERGLPSAANRPPTAAVIRCS